MAERAPVSVNTDNLFRVVRGLLGDAIGVALFERDGALHAANSETFLPSFADLAPESEWKRIAEVPRKILSAKGEGCVLHATNVQNFAGEDVATLVLSAGTEEPGAPSSTQNMVQIFDALVAMVETQLQLESELDAMAVELTGRYEELNLLYHSDDEPETVDRDGVALQRLVDHCVDHLQVSLVAICLPRQDQIVFAHQADDNLHEPDALVLALQERMLSYLRSHPDGLIANAPNDPSWTTLGFDLPYKVLCVPLLDSRGQVQGFIVCLRAASGEDFFNSDRNLLRVVGRKATKIVQSVFDELTGIYNRMVFESVLDSALTNARRRGRPYCLLNVNLDQVKVINDALGRDAGDLVIARSAQVLRQGLRDSDCICYLGEGKYGVVLEGSDLEIGETIAEKLRSLVEKAHFEWRGKPISATVSIGVSPVDRNTENAGAAVETAEIALDSAKRRGRNQIRVFSQDDEYLLARKAEMHWANYTQKALRENSIQLFMQPIHSVERANESYHFETLIRLLDEDGELVSPIVFLPAAEAFNLMPLIDRWVIDATLSHLSSAGFGSSSGEGVFAINLSGQTLADTDLSSYIGEKLTEYGIHPTCVCFEITETAAFGDFQNALSVCNDIKALGCALSLDDFGTGLSSFSYLQKLPVDYVKIDGSFVQAMLNDRVSHAMVAAINHVSHVMGLKTIAEYVENDVLRAELELMGVDYVQGFSYARPLPIADALALLGDKKEHLGWLRGAS